MSSHPKSFKQTLYDLLNFSGTRRQQLKFQALQLTARFLRTIGRGDLVFGDPVRVEQDRSTISNYTLLYPAETIIFGDPATDYFLQNCQYIENGRLERQNIFVCEVPNAKLFPDIGLVFDRDWRPIVESILDEERLENFKQVFRPKSTLKRAGAFSSIQHLWAVNAWHWMADSLPQVYSLDRYMQGNPLTLLLSNELGEVARETLRCILPPNFTVEYVDPNQWLELETFILPSHVASRANAFFPPDYYEFIRSNTFRTLNVPKPAIADARLYIARVGNVHRRILNDAEITALLAEFGFRRILIEDYDLRQQVELFRGAEAIVTPHGAALGGIMYADHLKVCVLYPQARPGGYFYTLALGLGHQHYCMKFDKEEYDDFYVDPSALRRVLVEQMGLSSTLLS